MSTAGLLISELEAIPLVTEKVPKQSLRFSKRIVKKGLF